MCGHPFQRARTGRPRRYCSDRCRKQALRDRQSFTLSGPLAAGRIDDDALRADTAAAIAAALADVKPSEPVDRLTTAIGETETLAVEYARLAKVTPRNLAVRADQMATHLREGLDRLFPRKDSP
jgi:hypothetical protein